jgi:hypothetical protein
MDGGRYNDLSRVISNARIKDKKVSRAIKTNNIEEMIEIEDPGIDPIDYDMYEQWNEADLMLEARK